MSADAAKKGEDKPVPSTKSTAVLLFIIAADTTWRMFVPIIGGTSLGVWSDNMYGSKPWMTIAGVAAGVMVAGLLVRQQLKRNTNES